MISFETTLKRFLANAALLAQFPLGHSVLLTRRGRAVLARLAPAGTGPTLSTTTYVTIAALQVFALVAFWSPTGTIWWRAEGSALVVMTVLYTGAWLLLGKSMLDAGLSLQTGSLGWTALLRGRAPGYPPMPTRGLFRFTRQPIYVAFTLTLKAASAPTTSPTTVQTGSSSPLSGIRNCITRSVSGRRATQRPPPRSHHVCSAWSLSTRHASAENVGTM